MKEQTRLDTPYKSDPTDKDAKPRSMRQRLRESGRYDEDADVLGEHENPAITYVWRLLNDAALTPTGGGGFGRPYLTQQDVTHYSANMGVEIDPLFIRALLLASRVHVNARAEHEQEIENAPRGKSSAN